MDYDLIPLLSDLLFKACTFWVILTVVIVVYIAMSRLWNWRWGVTEQSEEK